MSEYFAAFLDLRGRRCLVVGGGAIGERKARDLLECGALVSVVSPTLTPGRHALVNVVDDAAHCDFIVPSVLRRGPLQIAVSTGGRSPALAREIRRLEPLVSDDVGRMVEQAGHARAQDRATASTPEARRRAGERVAARALQALAPSREMFVPERCMMRN